MKELPVFNAARCKRCGICKHFCSPQCIDTTGDNMPYLARPKACTSCRICRDMCPDWAIQMREMAVEDVTDTESQSA